MENTSENEIKEEKKKLRAEKRAERKLKRAQKRAARKEKRAEKYRTRTEKHVKRVMKHEKPMSDRAVLRMNITKNQVDFWLLLSVIILIGLGTIMIFSASSASAYYKVGGTSYDVLKTQLLYTGVSVVVLIFFTKLSYRFISRFSIFIYIVSIGLLALVYSPLGRTYNKARRWIQLGIQFQPSEFLKFAVVLFVAYMLSDSKIRPKSITLRGFYMYILPLCVSLGLVALEPHISCVIILLFVIVAMMLEGGVRWPTFVLCIGLVGAAAAVLIFFADKINLKGLGIDFSYITDRVNTHLSGSEASENDAYQITQSLYAIGSGGLFGRGLGKSVQKYLYLPEPYNDFIFSILAEELGFIGVVVVIMLYTVLIMRGFKVSKEAPDGMGSLIAFGFTCNILIQVVLNLCVVSKIIPVTGVSLPFFSYGGTSLLILSAEMGMVLNISKNSNYEK